VIRTAREIGTRKVYGNGNGREMYRKAHAAEMPSGTCRFLSRRTKLHRERRTHMLALAMTLLAAIPAPPAVPADRAAIEETIGHYFRAGDTSSSQELRLAFHPATMMFFVKDGALTGVSQPEWWARTDANKTPVVALSRRIPVVDVTGDAGVAKILSDYPTHRFADYMSLMKINGRWWIVGKIFHRTVPHDAPPAASAAVAADREAIRATLNTLNAALDGSRRASPTRGPPLTRCSRVSSSESPRPRGRRASPRGRRRTRPRRDRARSRWWIPRATRRWRSSSTTSPRGAGSTTLLS
jgi:Putative lumazine-binding